MEDEDVIAIAKDEIRIFERPSVATSKLLIENVEMLREKLRLAESVIDKINDKKYRQMIHSYRFFTKPRSN